MRLGFNKPRIMIFLIVSLGIGCFLGLGALVDVLNYRALQRRLRKERQRRKP